MTATSQGPLNNPYDHLTRSRRRRLTASLLHEAAQADTTEREHLLEQVVLLNMCVARSVASGYRNRGIASDDLEQVAHMALVRCVRQFDVGRGRDLLSYVVPSVRGEVCRYFRDHGWVVKPPRRVQELQPRVIVQRDGGHRTSREIASRLGVSESDVDEAFLAEGCFSPKSLDAAVGDSSTTLGGTLADPSDQAALQDAEIRLLLRPVVRKLSRRDRELLRLRFFEGRTQQEIADEWGVSQTHVSRVLTRVLADLRQHLGEVTPA